MVVTGEYTPLAEMPVTGCRQLKCLVMTGMTVTEQEAA